MSESINLDPTPSLLFPSHGREWLRGGEVRGDFFRTRLNWTEQYHGEEGLKKVLDRLPTELNIALGSVRSGWLYPFEWLITLDRVIEGRFGRGKRAFHRELGRFSAFQEFLDRDGASGPDVHGVLRDLTSQHRFRQDFGSVSYEQTHELAGRLIHTEQVCFSAIFCANRAGYYEQFITMHGGDRAHVEESACVCLREEACVFELGWA